MRTVSSTGLVGEEAGSRVVLGEVILVSGEVGWTVDCRQDMCEPDVPAEETATVEASRGSESDDNPVAPQMGTPNVLVAVSPEDSTEGNIPDTVRGGGSPLVGARIALTSGSGNGKGGIMGLGPSSIGGRGTPELKGGATNLP